MAQLYQDAMAIVRRNGQPSYFITMTCNPEWPEIKRLLATIQTPQDRPDLISGVFNLKVATTSSETRFSVQCSAECTLSNFKSAGSPTHTFSLSWTPLSAQGMRKISMPSCQRKFQIGIGIRYYGKPSQSQCCTGIAIPNGRVIEPATTGVLRSIHARFKLKRRWPTTAIRFIDVVTCRAVGLKSTSTDRLGCLTILMSSPTIPVGLGSTIATLTWRLLRGYCGQVYLQIHIQRRGSRYRTNSTGGRAGPRCSGR